MDKFLHAWRRCGMVLLGLALLSGMTGGIRAADAAAAADDAGPDNSAGANSAKQAELKLHESYDKLKQGVIVSEPHDYMIPEKPTVYLTFDDGPSKLTPKVLDILKQEGVHATFFTIGQLAENRPDDIRRIVKEGHSLGNHSYNHVYKELYASFDAFWKQISQTDDILFGITGFHTPLVRAPGGTFTHFDAFYFYYMDQAGYSVFDWNVDSGDASRPHVPAKEIVKRATNVKLTHEMIVLMHDGSGHGETVTALPDIIRYYKKKGYTFATLDQAVKPIMFRISENKRSSKETFEAFRQHVSTSRKHLQVLLPEQSSDPAASEPPQPETP